MAKGDRWIKFGVYRRKGDAQSAASRIRRDNAFARVTKVKSGGFKVSTLWTPVVNIKGEKLKDAFGRQRIRPKRKNDSSVRWD